MSGIFIGSEIAGRAENTKENAQLTAQEKLTQRGLASTFLAC
jgi:hypothetical protein